MGVYEGRRAVVVGGTHGIGLGVVEDLLAGGARVLLTGNNGKNLEAVRGRLGPAAHAGAGEVLLLGEEVHGPRGQRLQDHGVEEGQVV